MTDRTRLETTYADLRPDDQIEDKAGNRWLTAHLLVQGERIAFWLCDLVTNVRMHLVDKPLTDPVTVWRLPKHVDQVAQLEAEMPISPTIASDFDQELVTGLLAETLGATVDLEVEAAEIDAAITAEDSGLPVELLAFADMTPLEQRTHLYVLHGIWATDVQSRTQLAETHNQAHLGDVNAKLIPHRHELTK